MAKGLTLTLNDLIKLGVIKFKRRKGRKGHKIKYKIENSTASTLRQPSDHLRGYATINNMPPIMNPYTDNLRLRDANDNFNTRLLEYKNQLHDEKLKTDDFMDRSKVAYNYLLHSVDRFGIDTSQLPIERRLGYDTSDSIDVADTSTDFQPQISQTQGGTSPYLTGSGMTLYETQKPSGIIQEEGEPSATIEVSRSEKMIPQTPEQPKKSIMGLFSSSSKPKKKLVIQEEEPETITTPANTKVGGGGGASVSSSTPVRTVATGNRRPTREEMANWRKWYEDLAGDEVDPSVTASPHRKTYQTAISNLLLQDYIRAGGNDSSILKSKDPNVINVEIRKLLKKQFK